MSFTQGATPKRGTRKPPPPPPGSSESINETANTVRKQVASGTGRAGQIGEGGFKAKDNTANVEDIDRMVKKNLVDRLAGKNPRFSDEIMQAQKEKLFRETQGQTRRGRMALMADAARRGVFRSEATGSLIRDVEVAGIQAYSSGVKDMMIRKAIMDHEDMVQAVNQSQQWVQATRQYQLGLEQNKIAREQIKATLAAAAMSAAATRYSADRSLEGARAAAGASRWAAQKQWESTRAFDSESKSYFSDADGNALSIQQATAAGLYP